MEDVIVVAALGAFIVAAFLVSAVMWVREELNERRWRARFERDLYH